MTRQTIKVQLGQTRMRLIRLRRQTAKLQAILQAQRVIPAPQLRAVG
jgi:hypothetical protein